VLVLRFCAFREGLWLDLLAVLPSIYQVTLQELTALQQQQQQQEERSQETQAGLPAGHQYDLVQLITSSQLWGFFQVHTSQLAPF
jgi:hypothetical protein